MLASLSLQSFPPTCVALYVSLSLSIKSPLRQSLSFPSYGISVAPGCTPASLSLQSASEKNPSLSVSSPINIHLKEFSNAFGRIENSYFAF
ncbi:MAG: hypothetical protein AABY22_25255, partial [Nanoarchaeota archaeon]